MLSLGGWPAWRPHTSGTTYCPPRHSKLQISPCALKVRAKQKLDSNGYLTGIAEVTFPDGETVYADKPTWLKELKATFERKSGDWNIARSRLNTVVQTLPGMVGLIE